MKQRQPAVWMERKKGKRKTSVDVACEYFCILWTYVNTTSSQLIDHEKSIDYEPAKNCKCAIRSMQNYVNFVFLRAIFREGTK